MMRMIMIFFSKERNKLRHYRCLHYKIIWGSFGQSVVLRRDILTVQTVKVSKCPALLELREAELSLLLVLNKPHYQTQIRFPFVERQLYISN